MTRIPAIAASSDMVIMVRAVSTQKLPRKKVIIATKNGIGPSGAAQAAVSDDDARR